MDAQKIDEFRWVFPATVKHLSSIGRDDAPLACLTPIKDPTILGELLVNRAYQSVWSNVEGDAGADLSAASGRVETFL